MYVSKDKFIDDGLRQSLFIYLLKLIMDTRLTHPTITTISTATSFILHSQFSILHSSEVHILVRREAQL